MTDFDAAAARRGLNVMIAVAWVGVLGLGLAGCETPGSLFGTGPCAANDPPPEVAAQPKPALAKVAVGPLVGAPDAVGKQIIQQLGQSAEKNRITILPDRDPKADYSLKGYFVASRDKAGAKVAYIWDVADASGKRVNRISGEEIAAGQPNAKDPWATVTPAVTQTIVDKTAASLAAWLPSQSAAPVAASPVKAAPAAGAGVASVEPAKPAVAASTNTQTVALPRGDDVAVVVPAVGGSPGDGNAALASALQRELSRQGIALVDRPGASYRVEGKVTVGQSKDGKQPIQIDWRVKDPQGKSLGTVSQKNEIPPGSLDGEWGKTADAAAAAATQGIVKLLPQPKSTN